MVKKILSLFIIGTLIVPQYSFAGPGVIGGGSGPSPLPGAYNWRETVATAADLPAVAQEGEMRVVLLPPSVYQYNGGVWVCIAGGGAGGFAHRINDVDGDTFVDTELNPDEDYVRLGTNGSEIITITNAGNVGIGITAPVEKLDVTGNIHASGAISSGATITIDGSVNPGTINATTNINIDGGKLFINHASGNIGVGTTAPGAAVDVVGGINSTSNINTAGSVLADTLVEHTLNAGVTIEGTLLKDNVIKLSADMDANNKKISNLATPLTANDAVTKDYVDLLVSGISWQQPILSVLNFVTSEPAAPTLGDRYINSATGVSSVTGQAVVADHIYQWNGTSWTNYTPLNGWGVNNVATSYLMVYGVGGWFNLQSMMLHNDLSTIQGGNLTERYHLLSSTYGDLTHANAQLAQLKTTGTPSFVGLKVTTGNVGIGVSSPVVPLEMKGELRIDGSVSGYTGFISPAIAGSTSYVLPAAAPSASGQLLSTDLTGTLSWSSPQTTRLVYVDGNRSDSYTEAGTSLYPYKTIQAAINYVASLVTSNPYAIIIANGHYTENLTLESVNLTHISLIGQGIVRIAPAAGNALQSATNNANLATLHVEGITFDRPVVLTGAAATTAFTDTIFKDCNIVSNSAITATCINTLSLFNCYVEKDITLSNVSWINFDGGTYQGNLSMTADSTADVPNGGVAVSGIMNGLYFNGTPTFVIGGSGTITLGLNGSKIGGSGSNVTIPTGASIIAQSSYLRNNWTVTGSLTLRNSNVQGTLSGAGTITYDTKGDQYKAAGTTGQFQYNNSTFAGSSALFTDGTNVGVGTTSPSYLLDINGDARVSTLHYTLLDPAINVGIGTAKYLPKWLDTDTLENSSLYDDGLGNVGIGTSTPSNRFEVWGTDTTDDGNYILTGSVEGGYSGYGFGRIIGGTPTFTWGINTYLGEDDEFLYFYNGLSDSNPVVISEGGRLGVGVSNIVDPHAIFTGTGLNDLSASGTYTYRKTRVYQVQINATGTPDTFQFRTSFDGITFGAWSAAQNCSTSPVLLEYGVSIAFGATIGHTVSDVWQFTAHPQIPQATVEVVPSMFTGVYTTTNYTVPTPTIIDVTADSSTTVGNAFTMLPTGTTSALYISRPSKYSSIVFNIVTAGVGVTTVLEYWNGAAWATVVSFTDGTTNFTTPGEISFDCSLLTGWATHPTYGEYPMRLRSSTNVTTAPTCRTITPNSDYRFAVNSSRLDGLPSFAIDSKGRGILTTLPGSVSGTLDLQSYRSTATKFVNQPQSVGIGNDVLVAPGGGTGLDKAVAVGVSLNCYTGNSSAGGSGNVLLGNSSTIGSGNSNVLAVGSGLVLTAPASDCIVFGRNTTIASGNGNNVFGTSNTVVGADSVIMGKTASVSAGGSAVSLGRAASVTGGYGVAVGRTTVAGANAISIGGNSSASGTNAVAVGYAATTGVYTSSVALGREATATSNNQLMIGSAAYPLNLRLIAPAAFDAAKITGSINNYFQLNIQNASAGNSASSDIVATADNGDENRYYIDMGINSSTYNDVGYTMTGINDGYLYVKGDSGTGGNLALGTGSTGGAIKFHTEGSLAANEKMRITAVGNVGIGLTAPSEKLEVSGAVKVSGAGSVAELTPSDGTLNVTGSIAIPADKQVVIGDGATEGDWRISRDGNNLVVQRRESGVWVTKGMFT